MCVIRFFAAQTIDYTRFRNLFTMNKQIPKKMLFTKYDNLICTFSRITQRKSEEARDGKKSILNLFVLCCVYETYSSNFLLHKSIPPFEWTGIFIRQIRKFNSYQLNFVIRIRYLDSSNLDICFLVAENDLGFNQFRTQNCVTFLEKFQFHEGNRFW